MQRPIARSAVVRYGVGVASVTVAVVLALWLRPLALATAQVLLVSVLITGWVLVAARKGTLSAARRRAEDRLKTARDGLEAEVRERTMRFRALINSVDGIVWEADATTFRFLFVSDQAERILGYPAERWLSEPTFWKDHIHLDDRESAVRFRQEARAERGSNDFEYRMIAADGAVVWFRDLASVMVEGDRPDRLRGVMVDITERKKAEEARRWVAESLDRVDRAIQGTNDLEQMMSDVLDAALAIFDCDRAWLMHPCDPEAVSHEVKMQRTRPEFPSLLNVGDDVPIDAETAEMFRTVRASSGPVQFGPSSAHPLSSELAQRRRVQSRIVMALYPKGEPPYIFGASQCWYARLWTPREEFLFQEIGRRLEDALTSLSIFHRLRESEKRYRHIFESTGVSIWEEDFSWVKAAIDDLKGSGVQDFRAWFAAHPQFVHDAIARVRMVDVNATSMKLFAAQTKDQLLASLLNVFVAETHAVFVEELVAIAEGRRFFEAETVLQTLKGERLTVLFTVTFPPSSARFDSVLVTLMDITGRKRAEYLTGHVFDTSPDAIYIVGRDYRYQRVNAAFERRWHLPAERIVGMRVDELAGTEAFEETFRPSLDRCFAGEDVSFGGWFLTPGGQRYLAATYSPLRLGSEGAEAVLAITRDLTDLVRASEALQQAQAELAHVTRVTTLGELAASIAHEVNQPLAAIVADANASLNWLATGHPDLDSVREALDAIVKDGHRAADVIQRIRQLATKTAPQKARLDANDVIRDVVPLVGTEVRRHAVSLRLDLAPASLPILGDRVQLQQVLINFVINGIEAMESVDDRPRELVIRSLPHDGGHVLVAVQDAGIGLDANKTDQLFNAFFTTKLGGMGMGLSISRSIIEGHGGRLWATPNPEHGATFHFALPAMQ